MCCSPFGVELDQAQQLLDFKERDAHFPDRSYPSGLWGVEAFVDQLATESIQSATWLPSL